MWIASNAPIIFHIWTTKKVIDSCYWLPMLVRSLLCYCMGYMYWQLPCGSTHAYSEYINKFGMHIHWYDQKRRLKDPIRWMPIKNSHKPRTQTPIRSPNLPKGYYSKIWSSFKNKMAANCANMPPHHLLINAYRNAEYQNRCRTKLAAICHCSAETCEPITGRVNLQICVHVWLNPKLKSVIGCNG